TDGSFSERLECRRLRRCLSIYSEAEASRAIPRDSAYALLADRHAVLWKSSGLNSAQSSSSIFLDHNSEASGFFKSFVGLVFFGAEAAFVAPGMRRLSWRTGCGRAWSCPRPTTMPSGSRNTPFS